MGIEEWLIWQHKGILHMYCSAFNISVIQNCWIHLTKRQKNIFWHGRRWLGFSYPIWYLSIMYLGPVYEITWSQWLTFSWVVPFQAGAEGGKFVCLRVLVQKTSFISHVVQLCPTTLNLQGTRAVVYGFSLFLCILQTMAEAGHPWPKLSHRKQHVIENFRKKVVQ